METLTDVQVASALDLFIKEEILGGSIIAENDEASFFAFFGLKKPTIHFELDIEKGSVRESFVSEKIIEFFNNHGFSCELSRPNEPHWNVFVFLKNGERRGTFNCDIYPKYDRDVLFITVNQNRVGFNC